MNCYTLYIHIVPNGKVYIGITCRSVQIRWRNSGRGYSKYRYFWSAIQKYGWNNIEHIILATNLSKEWACKLEQDLIREFKANDRVFGYNLSVGGEFNSGFHYQRTDEWKEKQRQMLLGTHHSEETKRKLSEINRNRDPEILKKISVSLRKSGKQRAEKRRQTMKEKYPDGFKQSAEANLKRSQALKGIKRSEETRAKMRKPKSPEAVENMRKAQQKRRQEQQLTQITGGR